MMRDDWPVFVISLADAIERRAPLLDQLRGFNLSFTVVEAVDGRRGLSAGDLARVDRSGAERRVGRPVSDRELACALSHQAVYRRILDEHSPGGIVLEDDAILTPLFPAFL